MPEPDLNTLTAEELLSSSGKMDWFTTRMVHLEMMNRNGGAFRKSSFNYWENGILIHNSWRNTASTSIQVASDRSATCHSGCQDPRVYGNPHPKLSSGSFKTVWDAGNWTNPGPWQKPITEILERLIERMRSIVAKREADKVAEQEAREAKLKEEQDRLLAAWS